MRTIDADHVTTMLHEYVKREQSYIDIGNNRSVAMGHRNGLLEAITQIAEEPTIEPQRWIPCNERIPEECEDMDIIVTYVDDEETRIIPVNYGKGTWYDCIFDTALNPIKVIAWMPLPPSYKGGQE